MTPGDRVQLDWLTGANRRCLGSLAPRRRQSNLPSNILGESYADHALNAGGARVSFAEIETDRGHDAFLLDVPEFLEIAHAFLQSEAAARGLPQAGN